MNTPPLRPPTVSPEADYTPPGEHDAVPYLGWHRVGKDLLRSAWRVCKEAQAASVAGDEGRARQLMDGRRAHVPPRRSAVYRPNGDR